MMEQVKKTPEEIKANRIAGMAKARAVRAAKLSEKKGEVVNYKDPIPGKEVINTRSIYFDEDYHNYQNFVEGMKIAMRNLEVKSKNDVAKCIPVAEEFVRICGEKYLKNG